MRSFARVVLAVVVAVCGASLTVVFALNAVRGGAAIYYVKAIVAAVVTARLMVLLRQDRSNAQAPTGGGGNGRNAKLIAIGLAIGLGAPFLLLWLITSSTR